MYQYVVNLKTAQQLTKNQHGLQGGAAAGAAVAPAVGGGFAADGGGGGAAAAPKPKKEDQSMLPGHGGPSGPVDKLHGGELVSIDWLYRYQAYFEYLT